MSLAYKRKNVWQEVNLEEKKEIFEYGERYKKFLDNSKTERLATKEIVRQAKEKGFIDFNEALKKGIKKGDKVYYNYKGKSVVLLIMGDNLLDGMNIIGSHIDAPRLDLKPCSLYEAGNLGLLKTHYYGGVKKYQWVCIPLAIHGVVIDKNGNTIDINVGEDDNDPVLYINDLLIHLSADQLQKKLGEGITGEQLNAVIGHCSYGADKDSKNPIKDNVLGILNRKYSIDEEDLMISELELTPAGKSRDVGFDRAMIAGHGHDDRVCSYANLEAVLEVENPTRTVVGLFVDKEEVGSIGNTGMTSAFFENMIADIFANEKGNSLYKAAKALQNSRVLSADVTNGTDPSFPEVDDPLNCSKIGYGVTLSKYTGHRGKGGCNDANAEYLGFIRKIFNENDVIWQTGELGKIDQGGGGTIAYILANKGAEVIDCGTPMLSMHAPMELVSKADAYMTYKAYRSFAKSE